MKIINDKLKSLNSIYIGKVENRDDPNKQGRVKVRVFNLHSQEISIEKLPWFLPAFPITAQQFNGIGDSGIPQIGSIVIVQFIEGNILQGIYTHTIPGEKDLPNPNTYLEKPFDFRQIKTPSGHLIEIKNKELRIKQDDGKSLIEIVNGVITINAEGKINIKSAKEVNVEGDKITLKENGKGGKGNIIVDNIKFLSYFSKHTHPTGVGPSGPPIPGHGFDTAIDWFTDTIKVD